MQLTFGDSAPALDIQDIDGLKVRLQDLTGRFTHLSFHRFVGCPMCNLHVHQMVHQSPEMASLGLNSIAFFESGEEVLRSSRTFAARSSFRLVADPQASVYARYGMGVSLAGALKGLTLLDALRSANALGLTRNNPKRDGHLNRIPADFIVGPDLRIAFAHDGKDTVDHASFGALEAVVRRSLAA
jgi:peroxiredoxin Q/BCP